MYAAPDACLAVFWSGLKVYLKQAGVSDVPEALDEPADLDIHWRDSQLLLSQTCGLPLTTSLRGAVRYVGTPAYRADGCVGPSYCSAVVVRDADPATSIAELRDRGVAFNSRGSQSGYNALRALVAPLARGGRFFAQATETGSHRLSVAAVQSGAADVAAVDVVTLALLRRDQPGAVAGLRVIHHTDPVPGLPLVTAASTSDAVLQHLRSAWRSALADGGLDKARTGMLLVGFEVLPASAYAVIPAMAAQAAALGYPDLA